MMRSMSSPPQVTVVMSLIGKVVPMCFGLIEMLEAYHPRTVRQSCTPAIHCFLQAMQWMLTRIMALNLLSLYSLMFALFDKTQTYVSSPCVAVIFSQTVKFLPSQVDNLHKFKMLNDSSLVGGGSTVLAMAESVECFPIPVPCHILQVSSLLCTVLYMNGFRATRRPFLKSLAFPMSLTR